MYKTHEIELYLKIEQIKADWKREKINKAV